MTDVQDRYIDPNSGAAPQPGGYAGAHAFADGHGSVPAGYQLAEDGHIEPAEAPEITDDGGLDEFSTEEAANAKALETQAIEVPEPEQSDLGQSDGGSKDYSELLSGNVKDVDAYLEEHPDERDAVVEAEQKRAKDAGKDPRKGIVGE